MKTFDAPAPSASYRIGDALGREKDSGRIRLNDKSIPSELKDQMQDMRKHLVEMQEEAMAKLQKRPEGPAPPTPKPRPLELNYLEPGDGHRKPQPGNKVRLGYVVALEDGSVIDMQHDFEFVVASGMARGGGEVTAAALDEMLQQMLRGQAASTTCALKHLFAANSQIIAMHGPDTRAVCEVKLLEILLMQDCSFTKDAGEFFKEVLNDGVGSWCDNPTDEGSALLRIEQVLAEDGTVLFPTSDQRSFEVRVVVGNGQVCDGLEAAMLQMRRHETVFITSSKPGCFEAGLPLGKVGVKPELGGKAPSRLRATLVEYSKGPDVWSFEEEDRLKFAMRRKLEATRLFKEGRHRLARERYQRILELFHHIDKTKSKERFYNKPELFRECRALRLTCRLNIAACSLKLQEPVCALTACTAALEQEPDNTKALYRRAQANVQLTEYVQACSDLQRLLDIDSSVTEAKTLLERAKRCKDQAERNQLKKFSFKQMISNIGDPRSDKNDYMDAPVDTPTTEDRPIADRWVPKQAVASSPRGGTSQPILSLTA